MRAGGFALIGALILNRGFQKSRWSRTHGIRGVLKGLAVGSVEVLALTSNILHVMLQADPCWLRHMSIRRHNINTGHKYSKVPVPTPCDFRETQYAKLMSRSMHA